MKVTIITDHLGNLVGTIKGHSLSSKNGDIEARIVIGPGRMAHHVEVDEALGEIKDGSEFHEKIKKYIPKA